MEAGLGFAVKTDKPSSQLGQFIGRDAVLAKQEAGLKKRLVQFQLEDPAPLLYLTSGNYGHHLGSAIGLGYVACRNGESVTDILSSSFEIDVAGQICAAKASLKPLYDPTSARMKG